MLYKVKPLFHCIAFQFLFLIHIHINHSYWIFCLLKKEDIQVYVYQLIAPAPRIKDSWLICFLDHYPLGKAMEGRKMMFCLKIAEFWW